MIVNAQDTVLYHLEFQEGQNVELLNSTVTSDNTLSITTNKSSLNSFLSGKPLYKFEKAFPLFTTPRLQGVYLIEVPVSYNITSFSQRSDVVQLIPYEEEVPVLLSNTEPNDYIENLQEERPNPSLDLIKAPLAWLIPNPEDYININPNPWHFCLLARISSADDMMTTIETPFITDNVTNNTNLAWKNTTVVDLRTLEDTTIGGVIAIANNDDIARSYILELRPKSDELGKPLYEEAEITIAMDANLLNAWQGGGEVLQEFSSQFSINKKIVSGPLAQLQNIQLATGQITTAYISFNFLTKELTSKKKFIYEVLQRDAITNEIIGGETFEIRKDDRPIFTANAGEDKEIEKNESVTLVAAEIDENATYNWYDPEGTLIYTGSDFTLSPDVTKKYKLEIISDVDGLKEYDEVEVKVNPYKLESISPNPVSANATVIYDAELANSAYLRIVHTNSGTEYNYILDILETSTAIDTSLFATGSYVVALICNGEFQTSKILVKQ